MTNTLAYLFGILVTNKKVLLSGLKFSALIVERQDVWYMDDGGLSYTLCEDNSPLAEPPVTQPPTKTHLHLRFLVVKTQQQ